jgi:hypothetical protein
MPRIANGAASVKGGEMGRTVGYEGVYVLDSRFWTTRAHGLQVQWDPRARNR